MGVHLVREPFCVRLDHRSVQAVVAAVVLDVMGVALVFVSTVSCDAGHCNESGGVGLGHGGSFRRVRRVAPLDTVFRATCATTFLAARVVKHP